MAKTLAYTGVLGVETVSFGEAGQFTKGSPRIIEDDALAAKLLAKGCFEDQTPAPAKTGKAATGEE